MGGGGGVKVGEDGKRISIHVLTLVRFSALRVTLGTV